MTTPRMSNIYKSLPLGLFKATVVARLALIVALLLGYATNLSQGATAAESNAPANQSGPLECIEFDRITSPPGGPTYHFVVGDTFKEAGAKVIVEDFFDGTNWINFGNVFVDTNTGPGGANGAGGSGYEANVANTSISIHYPRSFKNLEFYFGEYGGLLNIEINGEFVVIKDFAHINGATIGGVDVKVINGFGQDMGIVYLIGLIKSVKIGGEELWLDHICPEFDKHPATRTPTPTSNWTPTSTPWPSHTPPPIYTPSPTPPLTPTTIPTITATPPPTSLP